MRKLLILLLLPLLLLACNRSGMGIFYSISEEQPLDDTNLDNGLTVTGMVRAGTDYFMSAGTLFSRTAAEGIWSDSVAMPSGLELCFSLVLFDANGKLYGLFADTAGVVTGLYSTLPDPIDWAEVATFDNRLTALTATSTALYVTEMLDIATYITHSLDSADISTTLSLSGQYTSVTDSAVFGAETWLLSGTKIFRGSSGSFTELTGAPVSTAGFRGVFASQLLSAIFISNAEGQVYASSDGTVWSTVSVLDSEDEPVPLYDMTEVDILGNSVVLVGSKNGYYDIIFEGGAYVSPFELVIPGSTEAASYSSSDVNFLKIDLRSSAVSFFFVDTTVAATSTVFACTSGNGLWINPITGGDMDSLSRKWDRQ